MFSGCLSAVICNVRLDHDEHGKFRLIKKEGSLRLLLFDDEEYTYIIARPRVAAMGSTGS